MDYQQVKELIRMIELSEFTQFELNFNNVSLKLSKNAVSTVNKPLEPPCVKMNTEETLQAMTIIPDEKKEVKKGEVVASPIVGTFYESSSPDKPPFVKVGDKVKKGDTLCIIEAMKIMNEITSLYDGIVSEICAENEAMVEYNQPLFRIV